MSLTGPLGSASQPSNPRCFYCTESIDNPAVEWLGDAGVISLHPGCVVEFTIRLYRDLHELESRTGVYVAREAQA